MIAGNAGLARNSGTHASSGGGAVRNRSSAWTATAPRANRDMGAECTQPGFAVRVAIWPIGAVSVSAHHSQGVNAPALHAIRHDEFMPAVSPEKQTRRFPPLRSYRHHRAARRPIRPVRSAGHHNAPLFQPFQSPETHAAQSRTARISPSYRWHRPSRHIATNAPESAQGAFWARPSFGHRSGRVLVASPSSAAVRLRCGHHRGVSLSRSSLPACWVSVGVIRPRHSIGHRIQVRHDAADRRCRLMLNGLSPIQAPSRPKRPEEMAPLAIVALSLIHI